MTTLLVRQQQPTRAKFIATLKVASYLGTALLVALLLGLLLSGDWTLPMDLISAASFTA